MNEAIEVREPDAIKDADILALIKKIAVACRGYDAHTMRTALITLYSAHTWDVFGDDIQGMYKFMDHLTDSLKKGGLENMRQKG